jgi:predicted phage-related endonuclease
MNNMDSSPQTGTSRRFFLGGSDARVIMGNDADRLLRLWREKRGEVEPEDLSGDLIVQLGNVTEPSLVRKEHRPSRDGRAATRLP